jgi:hypothetical protein
MDCMMFSIMDRYGHKVCEPMLIPWSEVYIIKQTFICDIQYGLLILY